MLDSLFGRAAPKREYPSGQVRPILLNQAGCLSWLASLNSAPFGKRTGGDEAIHPSGWCVDRRPLAQ